MAIRDVLIIGAGPAGLAMACSLVRQGLSVSVVEKLEESVLASPPVDGRDIALTFRSRDIMQSLGIWARLPQAEVATIRGAKVEQEGSPHFLNLMPRTEPGKAAENLGFLVPNYCIRQAAYEAARSLEGPDLQIITGKGVISIDAPAGVSTVRLEDGNTLDARLVIAADSRFSASRRQMGIPAHMHDFGREVIVCRMQHEHAGDGVAYECFRWGRTLAVLPMNNNQVSVVMTVKTPDSATIMRLSPEELGREIEAQFDSRLGRMTLVGERHRYPLVAVYARQFFAARFALVGDAAVGMHPVTAHGYNFGLYGVQSLTNEIDKARRSGGDIGGEQVLRAYQRGHRRETWAIFTGTNALVKLFTDDRPPARVLRKRLLQVANQLQPLKGWITRHLTDDGSPRKLPRLLPRLR
jgi:ubiquinone biosynthesis UbiH/UbiF/VisC/COQ6 family hydroxylase